MIRFWPSGPTRSDSARMRDLTRLRNVGVWNTSVRLGANLEEEEADPGPPGVALAPAAHAELSHARVRP